MVNGKEILALDEDGTLYLIDSNPEKFVIKAEKSPTPPPGHTLPFPENRSLFANSKPSPVTSGNFELNERGIACPNLFGYEQKMNLKNFLGFILMERKIGRSAYLLLALLFPAKVEPGPSIFFLVQSENYPT